MAKLIKNIDLYTGYKHMPDAYMRFTDTIEEVGYMADFTARADDEVIDEATGQLVVPGFIDVHKHGGYGLDTMDGDPDKLNEMVNKMVTEGITSLFPVIKSLRLIRLFKEFTWRDLSLIKFSWVPNLRSILLIQILSYSKNGMQFLANEYA